MTEAAVPMLIGGGVQALGSYLGSQAAANAATQAANLQQQRFNQAVSYQQPYIQSGQNALNLYNNAVGVNGSAAQQAYYGSFQTDPGFQASVNYGLGQIQAQAAAQGQNLSGNTLAALQNYSQQNLNQAFNTRLDDLYRDANLGETAAGSLTTASTQSANNQGNFMNLAGQYLNTGAVGIGNALNNTAKSYQTYYYGTNANSGS